MIIFLVFPVKFLDLRLSSQSNICSWPSKEFIKNKINSYQNDIVNYKLTDVSLIFLNTLRWEK